MLQLSSHKTRSLTPLYSSTKLAMECGGYAEYADYNESVTNVNNNNISSYNNKNTKHNHHVDITSQTWQMLNTTYSNTFTQDPSTWLYHPTSQPQHSNLNKQKFDQAPKVQNNTSVNSAYDALRSQVPTFPYEKRLSKIDTLQLTIAYISLLRDILSSNMEPVEYIQHSLTEEDKEGEELEWNISDLTARLHWVDWSNIGKVSLR